MTAPIDKFMKIYGIDFTSSPSRRKPITCITCELDGAKLNVGALLEWETFDGFETALNEPGPWLAGIDFPFGQARRFIETIGWPDNWRDYVLHAAAMGRETFVDTLNEYRSARPAGDKEHRRQTDKAASSISPQKLYGVPVGKMFFEGAPRLVEAGVTVPGLQVGDPDRIVVEAYPGFMARNLIGKRSYKNDTKKNQTPAQHHARLDIFEALKGGDVKSAYGIEVTAPLSLVDDPSADHLDALLCAVQAAWSWNQRNNRFGEPQGSDPLEGWIADPLLK